MYINLINKYNNVIFISYYDLIYKENVVEYLSNKLNYYNLTLRTDHNIFLILNQPSKNHGKSVHSCNEAILLRDKINSSSNMVPENTVIIKFFEKKKFKKLKKLKKK